MIEYKGIKIDVRPISQGIYNMFSEEDRTIMAFGMIPYPWIELLRKLLAEKADNIIEEYCQKHYELPRKEAEEFGNFDEFKKGFVDFVENEVTRDFYQVAEMVV